MTNFKNSFWLNIAQIRVYRLYIYIYIYICMYVVKFDTKATELFRKMALFEFMTNFVKRENSRLITS